VYSVHSGRVWPNPPTIHPTHSPHTLHPVPWLLCSLLATRSFTGTNGRMRRSSLHRRSLRYACFCPLPLLSAAFPTQSTYTPPPPHCNALLHTVHGTRVLCGLPDVPPPLSVAGVARIPPPLGVCPRGLSRDSQPFLIADPQSLTRRVALSLRSLRSQFFFPAHRAHRSLRPRIVRMGTSAPPDCRLRSHPPYCVWWLPGGLIRFPCLAHAAPRTPPNPPKCGLFHVWNHFYF